MRTNTNKLLTGALLMSAMLVSGVSAATNIGTGTVVSSGALTAPIIWNDIFSGGTATGTINGLVIQAQIQPTLNMVISGSGVIDLGNLSSTTYSTGTVSIEIGTNAMNGASVTARSINGGLKSTDGTQFINSLTTDTLADSYRFTSVVAATDSTIAGFTHTGLSSGVEVNNAVTNNVLYTSNKPQPTLGVNDFTFSVSAKPNDQTPAGKFTDTVVITVTGNF